MIFVGSDGSATSDERDLFDQYAGNVKHVKLEGKFKSTLKRSNLAIILVNITRLLPRWRLIEQRFFPLKQQWEPQRNLLKDYCY